MSRLSSHGAETSLQLAKPAFATRDLERMLLCIVSNVVVIVSQFAGFRSMASVLTRRAC